MISHILQGECADAPLTILINYEPRNILNADEIGPFNDVVGNRPYIEGGSDPAGGKKSKKDNGTPDRCYRWAHGEDGRHQQGFAPRGFSRINGDLTKLPPSISWYANDKAWMNAHIFEDYLIKLNEKNAPSEP